MVRREVSDKEWGVTLSNLSHTPMTKEAAQSHRRSVQQVLRELRKSVSEIDKRKLRKEIREGKEVKSKYWVQLGEGDTMSNLGLE